MSIPASICDQNYKESRIFNDKKIDNAINNQHLGIRASKSRWSWLGRSIKYQASDGKTYYLNLNSAKKFLNRNHILLNQIKKGSILKNVEILDLIQKINFALINPKNLSSLAREIMQKSKEAQHDEKTQKFIYKIVKDEEFGKYEGKTACYMAFLMAKRGIGMSRADDWARCFVLFQIPNFIDYFEKTQYLYSWVSQIIKNDPKITDKKKLLKNLKKASKNNAIKNALKDKVALYKAALYDCNLRQEAEKSLRTLLVQVCVDAKNNKVFSALPDSIPE